MKIIVGVSTNQEFELAQDELYESAEVVASLINMDGMFHCNFLRAKDGTLVMPKQVVYIRTED